MSEFVIRPFAETEADYEGYAAVVWAVWPEYPDTVEELKHWDDARDPSYFFQRFVALVGGQIVAAGTCCDPWWASKPGKYDVSVEVHPAQRRQGIGAALYEHMLARLAEFEPKRLTAKTREDQAEGLRFLARRGFRQVMRYPISHLRVADFDPGPFAETVARVQAQGITILPLAELTGRVSDWKQKLWDLDWAITQDVPLPDPPTRLTFETFENLVLGGPSFRAEAQFIALDGESWVGMSGLWLAQGDPTKLYTGLTGVVRSHRRRGIATAVKVRAIDYARQYGAQIVETDNEENNPMYQLNLKLGFEPQPAWLDFEKNLTEPEQEEAS